jgi:hypothetical protein
VQQADREDTAARIDELSSKQVSDERRYQRDEAEVPARSYDRDPWPEPQSLSAKELIYDPMPDKHRDSTLCLPFGVCEFDVERPDG